MKQQLDLKELFRIVQKDVEAECLSDGQVIAHSSRSLVWKSDSLLSVKLALVLLHTRFATCIHYFCHHFERKEHPNFDGLAYMQRKETVQSLQQNVMRSWQQREWP